jgi:hypothetical protein
VIRACCRVRVKKPDARLPAKKGGRLNEMVGVNTERERRARRIAIVREQTYAINCAFPSCFSTRSFLWEGPTLQRQSPVRIWVGTRKDTFAFSSKDLWKWDLEGPFFVRGFMGFPPRYGELPS